MLTAVVYRSCLMKDGQVTEEQSYDRYVKISDVEFAVEDMDISSLNYGFKYIHGANGRLVSADVHRFSNNNPDAAHAFDMMGNTEEPFLYFPYLMGNHPFTSRLLPDGYMAVSGLTTRTKVPFTYEYDEDGYISSMTWVTDKTDYTEIGFEYQQ